MNIAVRRYVTPVVCAAFALSLIACSQSSSAVTTATPASNTFDGAPIVQAKLIAQPAEKQIAYSDASLKGWRSSPTQAPFASVPSSTPAYKELSITGDGEPIASTAVSPVISVTPGAEYTISAWIDTRGVRDGHPILWVSNSGADQIYGSSKIVQTRAARYGFDIKIPDHVSKITLAFYTNGSMLAKGATMTFSQPLIARP